MDGDRIAPTPRGRRFLNRLLAGFLDREGSEPGA
jgi:hypothetical protein